MNFKHQPVLLKPIIEGIFNSDISIDVKEKNSQGAIYVDCTFGYGGHSIELLKRLGPHDKLIAIDKDCESINFARKIANNDPRLIVVHSSFSKISKILDDLKIKSIDGIIFDLGVSSPQLDDPNRGFSFMKNGPLDMRMDKTKSLTAADWLSTATINEIKNVLTFYGEERFSLKIAKKIFLYRQKKRIETTLELASIIKEAIPIFTKKNPATKAFQALRIHINQELDELFSALKEILGKLKPGARLAVISFHSLEDRIVKKFINIASQPSCFFSPLAIFEEQIPKPLLKKISRIYPSFNEIKENSRSRSAILRIAERTDNNLDLRIYNAFQSFFS